MISFYVFIYARLAVSLLQSSNKQKHRYLIYTTGKAFYCTVRKRELPSLHGGSYPFEIMLSVPSGIKNPSFKERIKIVNV